MVPVESNSVVAKVEETSPRKKHKKDKEKKNKQDKKRKHAEDAEVPTIPSSPSSSLKKHKKPRTENRSQRPDTLADANDSPEPIGYSRSDPKQSEKNINGNRKAVQSCTTTITDASSETPFRLINTSLYVPLSPLYSQTPHHSVETEHLDPLVLTYYPPLQGIILAYKNLAFKQKAARIANDSPFAYMWISVDFLVCAPKRGMMLEGWVNLMSESHIGLLVLNTFNASIPREKIPEDWKWVRGKRAFRNKIHKAGKTTETANGKSDGDGDDVDTTTEGSVQGTGKDELDIDPEDVEEEDSGSWMDSHGNFINGLLRFKVDSFKASGHIISIAGTLVDLSASSEFINPRVRTSLPATETLSQSPPFPSGPLPGDTAQVTEPTNEIETLKKKIKQKKRSKGQ